jgi:hypothetical protein
MAKVSLRRSLKDPFIAVDANGIESRADVVDMLKAREQMDRLLTVKKQEVRVNRTTKWRSRCLKSEKSFVDLCQDSDALLHTRYQSIILARSNSMNLVRGGFSVRAHHGYVTNFATDLAVGLGDLGLVTNQLGR